MQHSVRDGQRQLTFDGTLLAESSSRRPGNPRWVEFELYRTAGGHYVLSRTGRSTCYHTFPECAVVLRNRIDPRSVEELDPEATACSECRSRGDRSQVYPEQPRFWAQASETAEGVINSLYKYDETGISRTWRSASSPRPRRTIPESKLFTSTST